MVPGVYSVQPGVDPADAIFVHVSAALITIGAFIIHVYMGVWFVPGSTHAMLFGSVPAAWAKHHHLLWYRRVTGETGSKE